VINGNLVTYSAYAQKRFLTLVLRALYNKAFLFWLFNFELQQNSNNMRSLAISM